MTDFELLKLLAQKWVEPLDNDTDPNKTVAEWRREVAALMSEVVLHLSKRS